MTKPRTEYDFSLWRAKASCAIGKKALNLEAETPPGSTPLEYAVYCLLSAIEDLAEMIDKGGK